MVFNSLNKFKIYNLTDENVKKYEKDIKKVLQYTLKCENVKKAVFNVILVDNKYIRKINKEYRNIDKETDVISFALEDYKDVNTSIRVLGDIYISLEKAKSQALEYGHSLKRELAFLAVHGLLHLLGYNHENKEEEKIMFGKQEMVLNAKKYER